MFLKAHKRLTMGVGLFLLCMVIGLILGVVTAGRDPDPIERDGLPAIDIGKRWPGNLEACVTANEDIENPELPNCYREPVDPEDIVKQPWSTWSSLAFCVVGLFILFKRDRDYEAGATPRMGENLTVYGVVALLMGPGAMAFHGTLTTWGGNIDQSSMYPLLASIIALDVSQLHRASSERVLWSFPLWFSALFGLSVVAIWASGGSTLVFMLAAVGTGLWTLASRMFVQGRKGLVRNWWLYGLSLVALGSAIVPWYVSNPAQGNPTDEFPYHALWHLLSAVFVLCYWWYLRSEREVAPTTAVFPPESVVSPI